MDSIQCIHTMNSTYINENECTQTHVATYMNLTSVIFNKRSKKNHQITYCIISFQCIRTSKTNLCCQKSRQFLCGKGCAVTVPKLDLHVQFVKGCVQFVKMSHTMHLHCGNSQSQNFSVLRTILAHIICSLKVSRTQNGSPHQTHSRIQGDGVAATSNVSGCRSMGRKVPNRVLHLHSNDLAWKFCHNLFTHQHESHDPKQPQGVWEMQCYHAQKQREPEACSKQHIVPHCKPIFFQNILCRGYMVIHYRGPHYIHN